MKRFLFAAMVLMGSVGLGNFALGDDDEDSGPVVYDKIYDVMIADFEDTVVETEHFIINNVLLTRVRNDYSSDKNMEQLTFGASIRGRTSKGHEAHVMLAGFDDKKQLLWTAGADNSAYGKSVGSLNETVTVPQGSLKSTASVWMRVVVVTKAN
jgi:hypothetical protein